MEKLKGETRQWTTASHQWNSRVVWSPTRLADLAAPSTRQLSVGGPSFLIQSLFISDLCFSGSHPFISEPTQHSHSHSHQISNTKQKNPNNLQVAEIFLSASVQVLFDKLASRQLLEFATRRGIRPRLKKLEANLKMITKVITHAENMLFRETEVDEWLEEVRAYDADDFLD